MTCYIASPFYGRSTIPVLTLEPEAAVQSPWTSPTSADPALDSLDVVIINLMEEPHKVIVERL
eukprot:3644309-Amphidinium_carterae.4